MAYPYRKLIKPRLGSKPYKGHRLSKGLVGLWLMNEGSGNKVFDLSGNGNDGTLTGADWLPDGPEFTDGADKCTISGTAFSSKGTIVIGFRATSASATSSRFFSNDQTTDGIVCYRLTDTTILFVIGGDSYGFTVPNLWDGKHRYLVWTWDDAANLKKLYVDGVLIDTDTGAFAWAGFTTFYFGNRLANSRQIEGVLSMASHYNRVLSASEVALLYREMFCMFKDPAEIALLGGYQAAGGTILPQITTACMRISA